MEVTPHLIRQEETFHPRMRQKNYFLPWGKGERGQGEHFSSADNTKVLHVIWRAVIRRADP